MRPEIVWIAIDKGDREFSRKKTFYKDVPYISISSLREFLEDFLNRQQSYSSSRRLVNELIQWLQQEDDQQEVEALTDIKASERK